MQQETVDLAFGARMAIPNSVPFPILIPIELFQIVFLTIIQRVGDHTAFVQEEQLRLQCWPKISAACVVVDLSKYLDILT